MYKRILCPVDGSDSSKRSSSEAIKLAKESCATIRFLHVIDTYYPTLDGIETANYIEVIKVWHERGISLLEQAKADALAGGVNADSVMLETLSKRVSDIVISQAKEWPADLIVMGTHGRRGLNHLLMGSDAEAVIRASPVPVLTVRTSAQT
jgi:nucleotide-binding universal stress UspA family protein